MSWGDLVIYLDFVEFTIENINYALRLRGEAKGKRASFAYIRDKQIDSELLPLNIAELSSTSNTRPMPVIKYFRKEKREQIQSRICGEM